MEKLTAESNNRLTHDEKVDKRRQLLKQTAHRAVKCTSTQAAIAMLLGATTKMASATCIGGGCGCGGYLVTADANGPYTYNADTTSVTADG